MRIFHEPVITGTRDNPIAMRFRLTKEAQKKVEEIREHTGIKDPLWILTEYVLPSIREERPTPPHVEEAIRKVQETGMMDEEAYSDPEVQAQLGSDWEEYCKSVQAAFAPAKGLDEDFGIHDRHFTEADRDGFAAAERWRKKQWWNPLAFLNGFYRYVVSRRESRLRPAERIQNEVKRAAREARWRHHLSSRLTRGGERSELRRVSEAVLGVIGELCDDHQVARSFVLPSDDYPEKPITKRQVLAVLRRRMSVEGEETPGRGLFKENDSPVFAAEVAGRGVHVISVGNKSVLPNLSHLDAAFPLLTEDDLDLLRTRLKPAEVNRIWS